GEHHLLHAQGTAGKGAVGGASTRTRGAQPCGAGCMPASGVEPPPGIAHPGGTWRPPRPRLPAGVEIAVAAAPTLAPAVEGQVAARRVIDLRPAPGGGEDHAVADALAGAVAARGRRDAVTTLIGDHR